MIIKSNNHGYFPGDVWEVPELLPSNTVMYPHCTFIVSEETTKDILVIRNPIENELDIIVNKDK